MFKARWVLLLGVLSLLGTDAPAFAQDTNKLNSYWENLDKRFPNLHKDYKTSPIQAPGTIQTPGEIQIPRGIKAITRKETPCSQHFVLGADTLFEFDKSTLTPFATETLKALLPMIDKLGPHPIKIEGHTDGKGTDEYNQALSEKRAQRVKNWFLENHVASDPAISIEGFGKRRPVAPNSKPDGSDNPSGRALNRRVEIIVDTCGSIPAPPAASSDKPAEPVGSSGGESADKPAESSSSAAASNTDEK